MSEQKYDVFQVVNIIGTKRFQGVFTKAELGEIMDGALYKQSDCLPFQWLYSREQLRNDLGWEYNETIDKWEWKNQLIELVLVEEV